MTSEGVRVILDLQINFSTSTTSLGVVLARLVIRSIKTTSLGVARPNSKSKILRGAALDLFPFLTTSRGRAGPSSHQFLQMRTQKLYFQFRGLLFKLNSNGGCNSRHVEQTRETELGSMLLTGDKTGNASCRLRNPTTNTDATTTSSLRVTT